EPLFESRGTTKPLHPRALRQESLGNGKRLSEEAKLDELRPYDQHQTRQQQCVGIGRRSHYLNPWYCQAVAQQSGKRQHHAGDEDAPPGAVHQEESQGPPTVARREKVRGMGLPPVGMERGRYYGNVRAEQAT